MNTSSPLFSLAAPILSALASQALPSGDGAPIERNFSEGAPATLAMTAPNSPVELTHPIVDQLGDGTIWVHGQTYKARFDCKGFEYIPFLGSEAPRDFPIDFTIGSARVGLTELDWQAGVQPELDGETVVFHRGAFDEVYVLGLDSIEQNFVVSERRTSGDLHVVVHTDTELERADGATGTAFGNGLGGANVGKASIRDARGRTVPSMTHLTGESIDIRVPQSVLETASFPLAIDPVVSTWTVTLVAAPTSDYPDTSYDWWTNTWLCVNQETFSASDHDIIARQFTPGGTLLNQTYIDFTVADWGRARVANHKAQHLFMVVAEVAAHTMNASVQGRTYSATTHSVGTAFTISPGGTGHQYWCPDIGGDTSPVGTRPFCVAYLESPSGGNPDPYLADYALVSPAGAVILQWVMGSAAHEPIKISKSNGSSASDTQRWNIVWSAFWGPGYQTFYQQVDSIGARYPISPRAFIEVPDSVPGYNTLSVSSLTDGTGFPRMFGVGSYAVSTDPLGTIYYINFDFVGVDSGGEQAWTGGGDAVNVPSNTQVSNEQVSVETDGGDFYCVYAEPVSGPHGSTQRNVYLNTYHAPTSGGVTRLQSSVVVAGTTDDESMPSVASMHSSGGGSSNMLCIYKRIATIGGAVSIMAAMLY